MIRLTKKQIEYLDNANARWNIKTGAVRSGKSFGDIAAVIPQRIIERKHKKGIGVIIGVSRDSVERNVLQPMREIYGHRISAINTSTNKATIFGDDYYCLGAEKISQVAKIQGMSIKYAYGDEIAKWNPQFFEMLKSRLDKPYSCFDGACNPEEPTHWFKKFLDNTKDLYHQHYTIFDNPNLPTSFVNNLCDEYKGTVYYDRYIMGLWKRAEGSIYTLFADDPERFINNEKENITQINVGVDFGGNSSGHAFVATGFINGYQKIKTLTSERIMQDDYPERIDASILDKLVVDFIDRVQKKYGNVNELYWDNAESVLGNTIRNAVESKYPHIKVYPAAKRPITDRINCTIRLMGTDRFSMTDDCKTLKTALSEAVWNDKVLTDERLDNGTSDIDSLDAFEYTFEREMRYLIDDR